MEKREGVKVSVELELEAEGDAVTGSVRDGSGLERSFAGWLGLAAVLEELTHVPAPAEAAD